MKVFNWDNEKNRKLREERGLLETIENGEWKSVDNLESEKARYREYAAYALKKDKRVNIRITEHDLESIQRLALEEGLPYQTFISSILHKYINGRLLDARTIDRLQTGE